jgi:hypothetical protein
MDGIAAPSMMVGRQGHHTDGAPKPVVRPPTAEERAVAAIVLPREEAGCRDSDDQGEPITRVPT